MLLPSFPLYAPVLLPSMFLHCRAVCAPALLPPLCPCPGSFTSTAPFARSPAPNRRAPSRFCLFCLRPLLSAPAFVAPRLRARFCLRLPARFRLRLFCLRPLLLRLRLRLLLFLMFHPLSHPHPLTLPPTSVLVARLSRSLTASGAPSVSSALSHRS